MDEIIRTAANISTPLALAGTICAFFFLIIRIILERKLIPQLPKVVAYSAVKFIVNRLFWLSLIAVVLGFLGFIASSSFPIAEKAVTANKSNDTLVFTEQMREIDELRKRLEGMDEHQLRSSFDFDELETKNVEWVKARYANSQFKINFDLKRYIAEGTEMMVLSRIILNKDTGETTDVEAKAVPFLILPEKYLAEQKNYGKLAESAYIPESIRLSIKQLQDTADKDVRILGDVLNASVLEFPKRYKSPDDMKINNIWIHNRYMDNFDSLQPKADEIVKTIRAYLHVDAVR
jgi:hypothetical protein